LGQQTHLDLRAAVDLGVATLPSAATHITDGHQIDVALVERSLDSLEPLGADDGNNELHRVKPLSGNTTRRNQWGRPGAGRRRGNTPADSRAGCPQGVHPRTRGVPGSAGL